MKLSMIVLCYASSVGGAKPFNGKVWHIAENYLDHISPFETGKFRKVQISLKPESGEQVFEALDVLDVRRGPFELATLLAMERIEFRHAALYIIHDAMMKLAIRQGWDTASLQQAFDKLDNSTLDRIVERNKVVFNPNRSRRAMLVGHHDEESFRVYAAVWKEQSDRPAMHQMWETKPIYVYYQPVFGRLKWRDNRTLLLLSRANEVVAELDTETANVLDISTRSTRPSQSPNDSSSRFFIRGFGKPGDKVQ
ncbi:MAG: hypothetical protein R3D57_20765 [Hyphomicrobiaceae bacterium]